MTNQKDPRSEGDRLSEIHQRKMRERVPKGSDMPFESIVEGQREAMNLTASEFAAPYLARIIGLETQVQAITRLHDDAEQSIRVQAQSYRDEIHCLRDRLTKLEAENKALRDVATVLVQKDDALPRMATDELLARTYLDCSFRIAEFRTLLANVLPAEPSPEAQTTRWCGDRPHKHSGTCANCGAGYSEHDVTNGMCPTHAADDPVEVPT